MSDAEGRVGANLLIERVQRDVKECIFRYRAEAAVGGAALQTRRELINGALRYHEVLRTLRNDPAVDDGDFPDMSPIENRIGKQVTVFVESNRIGVDETTKKVPAIDGLDPEFVLELIRELDDVATQLGHGPTSRDTVPNDKATHDDLQALLSARGQTDAVENLPGE